MTDSYKKMLEEQAKWEDECRTKVIVNPTSHDTSAPFNREQLEEAYKELKKLKIPTTDSTDYRLSNEELQVAIDRHQGRGNREYLDALLAEQLKRATDG